MHVYVYQRETHLMLAPLVLHRDGDASGYMCQTNSGFRFVNVLFQARQVIVVQSPYRDNEHT